MEKERLDGGGGGGDEEGEEELRLMDLHRCLCGAGFVQVLSGFCPASPTEF
jgi:hypothetical protein